MRTLAGALEFQNGQEERHPHMEMDDASPGSEMVKRVG